MCSKKGGGEGRKGSGDKAYTSADPGWNAAVGVKYALATTAAYSTSAARKTKILNREMASCTARRWSVEAAITSSCAIMEVAKLKDKQKEAITSFVECKCNDVLVVLPTE